MPGIHAAHSERDAASRPAHDTHDILLAEILALRQQVATLYEELVPSPPVRHGFGPAAAPESTEASCDAPRLYARLLGSFAIYRGHLPLSLGRSRAGVELCRYLVARAGQPVHRDELQELLWPEADADRTLHRLHVAVSGLRRMLDVPGASESLIQLDDDCYSIAADLIATDCDAFEERYRQGRALLACGARRAAAERFLDALSLYAGDYLADLQYADWTHGQRTHFAERRLNALAFLSEYAADNGDHASVVEYAQQIIEVDSLRERSHRHLMRSHYRLGQRACAIRQYQACARLLAVELGVRPSHETQQLFAAIRDDGTLPDEAPLHL